MMVSKKENEFMFLNVCGSVTASSSTKTASRTLQSRWSMRKRPDTTSSPDCCRETWKSSWTLSTTTTLSAQSCIRWVHVLTSQQPVACQLLSNRMDSASCFSSLCRRVDSSITSNCQPERFRFRNWFSNIRVPIIFLELIVSDSRSSILGYWNLL